MAIDGRLMSEAPRIREGEAANLAVLSAMASELSKQAQSPLSSRTSSEAQESNVQALAETPEMRSQVVKM